MEERLNDERRRKQNYLSNEILEQNFDSIDFQNFLESKKENGGADIDIWTYEQLVDLVREYKLLKKQVQTQSTFNRTLSKQNTFQNQDAGTPNSLVTSQFMDAPHLNDKYDFTQEDYSNIINCKPLHKSNINENDQIDISIDSFDVKQGGIISSSYAVFKISTKPYGYEVKRRFSEFLTFRNSLIKLFPGIAVPPIPAKAVGRTLETGYLNKRRMFLQRFLRDLIQIPELKCCRFFFEFISLDEATLKTRLKEWENFNRPEQVENFTSLNGQITLNINADIRNYIGKANDLVINSDSLYQRLAKLNKQLTKDYDQLSLTLYNISEVFMGLYNVNSTFNSSVNQGRKTILDDLYLTYNNLMVDLGNIMVNQVKVAQEDIKSFFKYEKNYNECVKDLIKERNSCYQEYDRARQKEQKRQIELTSNKKGFSSIFTKDDPKKLEKNLTNSRDKFGYFNQKVYDEIDRCLKMKGIKFVGNFGVFIENEFRLVSDMQEVWTFYREEIERLIEGEKSSLQLKKVDVKKVILVKKGDVPFENKLPNK